MLTLPVIKPRTYISPSAFKVWENCQNSFYHFYLAGHTMVQRATNRAAGIGIIFDAIIKDHLNKELGVNDDRLTLENLTKFIIWEEGVNPSEVFEVAGEVSYGYIKHKMYREFLNHTKIMLDRELYGIIGRHNIPILGVLDAAVSLIPFDWKLRGFNSKASPTKGYGKRMDSRGNFKKPHSDHIFPNNLETANYDWALQMLWYNWLLSGKVRVSDEDRRYIIHEITWDGNDWHFVEHKGFITEVFEETIYNKLHVMWDNISRLDCEIEEPQPNTYRCEKYGSICAVCQHCNEYMRTLGDPEYRVLFTQ